MQESVSPTFEADAEVEVNTGSKGEEHFWMPMPLLRGVYYWHYRPLSAFLLVPLALKGKFVTSRRNEKNMKVCAQNTSTTIYNLSTTSSRGGGTNHLFHK